MKVDVALIAFGDTKTRTVDVPTESALAADTPEDLLDLVYAYGQNNFQNQSSLKMRSVSTGDVIFLPWGGTLKTYSVEPYGFSILDSTKHFWDHVAKLKTRGF
jgi:hypothetical protein